MDVLVTGARGFVGMNIARYLATNGATVWAADRSPVDGWIERFLASCSARIHHITADLSTEGELLRTLDPTAELTAVVHAAVVTATTTEVEKRDARGIVDSNVGGTIEALNAAVELGASRFIYVSSPSAIGRVSSADPVDEAVTPRPDSLYGITKLASEQIVDRWTDLFELEAASVRIAQPYGPGERATSARIRTSPIWEWLRDAEPGAVLPTGPLERARDWTYVEDTAEGIGRLVTADRLSTNLYHLGTGKQARVADVFDALNARIGGLGYDEDPAPDALNPNIAGPGRPPLDVRRFESEFSWKPATSIQDGMSRYLDWWAGFQDESGSPGD
ncbi:MAG: NAD(P)-dependent oxidoreductase [Thermomicrobiales bacterium]